MGGIDLSIVSLIGPAGGMIGGLIGFGIVIIVILFIIALSCINIVPQAHAYVVERLGTYRQPGRLDFI